MCSLLAVKGFLGATVMTRFWPALCAILSASCALAPLAHGQEARDLCPDRPGLGTPACTVAPGTVVGELGLGDWTRQNDPGSRTDTVQTGEMLLRVGVTESMEVQAGWTAYGHVRTRDKATGRVTNTDGVGDVTLAVRQNLHNPDGSGFSLAVMPYVTLPVGGAAIGAGAWSAGMIVPVSFELSDTVSLALTPEVDVAADADGHGRHVRYGSVAGLGFALSGSVSVSTEVALYRDHDPAGRSTEALLGLSAAWQSDHRTQFDAGVNLGLNSDSPDSQIYMGVARRF